MSLEIRLANDSDIPTIHQIMLEVTRNLPSADLFASNDEEFIAKHISEEGLIALSDIDGVTSGFQVLRIPGSSEDNLSKFSFVEIPPNEVVHMESVAILPKARGKGLQKQLINFCEAIAIDANYKWGFCTVHPRNAPSLNNLLTLGYSTINQAELYGGVPRLIMAKNFGKLS